MQLLHRDCTISINNINRMNLDLMSVLVPTFKLGINDTVLLAEGDYRNTTCLGLLVIKFQYPFKIFTACHNRIFMFCSAKELGSCKMPRKQLSAYQCKGNLVHAKCLGSNWVLTDPSFKSPINYDSRKRVLVYFKLTNNTIK